MHLNKKILISEIAIFLLLLTTFSINHSQLQEINFEIQYRCHQQYPNYGEFQNPNYKECIEETKIPFTSIIPFILSLILLLNHLYYIMEKHIFPKFPKDKSIIKDFFNEIKT